jgi:hypothetical protein
MKRFLAAALLTASFAAIAPAADNKAKPVTVPFELIKSKHIAVKIKINGAGPYRVIFDTGAPVCLINNKIAKASGVLPKKFKPSPFAIFGIAGQFKIKSLEVGDIKAKNISTIVMDHPTVELISKVLGPIDGLIGFPFFARYKLTIDYQAKTLTFVPTEYKPSDVMLKLMESLMQRGKQRTKVLVPAAQWGFKVYKDDEEEESGVTVKAVLTGSAAAKAGLEVGDRLLSLDGRWTDTVAECYRAAGRVKAGTAAKVVIKRKDKELVLTVKPVVGI